jgi:hypothetical protein
MHWVNQALPILAKRLISASSQVPHIECLSPLTIDREVPQFSNNKFRDNVTSGSDALPADLIRISSLHHLESRDYDILGEIPYFSLLHSTSKGYSSCLASGPS